MAFTINDFQDLVQLLEEHPRWRNELRRLIVDDDFAKITQSIRDLIALSDKHEAQLTRLIALSDKHEAQLTQLIALSDKHEAQLTRLISLSDKHEVQLTQLIALSDRHEARLTKIESDISILKTDVAGLKIDVAGLKTDVGGLKGAELERTFRERPYVYLSRFARRIRLVSDSELAILIEDALDQKRLTDDEAEDLKRLDAIVKGKHKLQNYDVYLAVEASSVADEHDLERAQRRAKLLEKATGIPAFPVIAGDVSAKGIVQLAESRGVYWVSRT